MCKVRCWLWMCGSEIPISLEQDATWDSGATRTAYEAALDPDCAPDAQMSRPFLSLGTSPISS